MDALGNLQVVDLSTGTAGPIVGMFMADFGAEVIKIETPLGDPSRDSPGFPMWNRGKKSVVVDPKKPAQCRWLAELIAGADICIAGNGGTLQKFKLDAVGLLQANPRLILVEMPAYARTTPWLGGHESQGLLAAVAGVAWRQSSTDGGPVDSVFPHLLYVHGLWATVCTVAALVERESSGYGQAVKVSGINAVMEAAVGAFTVNPDLPDPSTAVGTGGRHPTYTRYRCKDGEWVACGALGGKFETRLVEALGLGDMLAEERMGGKIENLVLASNVDWAKGKIAAEFAERTHDELLKMIAGLGIPCGTLGPTEKWLDHAQVKAIGMRVEVDDPRRGPTTMPGVPINLTGSPGHVRGAAPKLGSHAASKIKLRPAPPRPNQAPPLRPGPLNGCRILDMGTFVAGPYTGSLLSELGADVVKVEPLTGDPFRATGFTYNRGMRSLALDLQDQGAREAFYEAVKAADVLIESLRPGVTRNLEIDYAKLSTVKPDVITVTVSAYGEGGPLSHLPGVDMVLQAMSGMMTAQGGDDEPVANTIAIIDVTTSAMCSLACALAIYHRKRTGQGQRIWNSLAATATYLQAAELVHYKGRPANVRGNGNFRGPGWLDRFYQVSDGWIRVEALSRRRPTLERLAKAGLRISQKAFRKDQGEALAAALAALPGDEAVRRIEAAGVAAVRARKVSAVLRDPALLADEFVHLRAASDGTYFVAPGRFATFSRTQRSGPMRVAGIGEHSREVLATAGMASDAIESLSATGAVALGGPMEQKLMPAYR
jgi:crotonobetainyl-CoA:carnitine CoA-transferase CaiB-like acyl-CoA transferase